jgi:hypothetical protein
MVFLVVNGNGRPNAAPLIGSVADSSNQMSITPKKKRGVSEGAGCKMSLTESWHIREVIMYSIGTNGIYRKRFMQLVTYTYTRVVKGMSVLTDRRP